MSTIIVDIHTAQHIRNSISEPTTVLNSYLLVLFNIMHLTEEYCGEFVSDEYKISLVKEVVSGIPTYNVYKNHHMRFIIQLYKLCGAYWRLKTSSKMYGVHVDAPFLQRFQCADLIALILLENILLIGGLYLGYTLLVK